MGRLLARLVTLLAALLIVVASGTSAALAGAKPPEPYPPEFAGLDMVGIHKVTGEYCDLGSPDPKIRANCRMPEDCEDYPAGHTVCVGEGSRDDEDAQRFAEGQLKRWREAADKSHDNYPKLNAFVTDCVMKEKKPFEF
ncbi:hypothetical protein LG634_17015 [Streptomyces bambusae]|uniref:hypothetical protein n=1 Tax=Streptomyces bambusae TaxID=1550616 RepID=UPI001CFDAB28|nr:hypothetical protein [Streptomyces bambusae]MCB5166534.1 hypothetical protein [Streptomyces bambusae]